MASFPPIGSLRSHKPSLFMQMAEYRRRYDDLVTSTARTLPPTTPCLTNALAGTAIHLVYICTTPTGVAHGGAGHAAQRPRHAQV